MTMVKKTAKPKASKAPLDPKVSPPKAELRSQAVSESLNTRCVSARVSPAQHREIRALASVNGETIQTLLLRLLRDAGVRSITDADLLDQRRGEGREQRKPKRASGASDVRCGERNPLMDQLDRPLPLLGLSGTQRAVPGGLTVVINNYLRPEPTT